MPAAWRFLGENQCERDPGANSALVHELARLAVELRATRGCEALGLADRVERNRLWDAVFFSARGGAVRGLFWLPR